MKTIKYFILNAILLLSLSLFQSCEDKLDIIPNNALVPETAFRFVEDLQNGLNSAYGGYNNSTIRFNSIFSDNTKIGIDNGGQEVPLHSFIMEPNTDVPSNIWTSRYTMINQTSRIIDASNEIDNQGRLGEVNHILGQAYALRAFSHFELFQYFTPDYLDPSGISVPAIDFVIVSENVKRNTVNEVLTLIETDLNKADGLLDASKTDNKFITKDFIVALRARVALFSGNYSDAITFANQLITKYPLANQSQYRNMFLDSDNTEVIFKAARVIGNARPGFIWHFGGGGPFIEMSNSLFNTLDVSDVRHDVLLNPASNPSGNLHLINKYPGTSVEFLSDVKVFRVSEMYLIKAEAELRSNDITASQSTLKALRDVRFDSATPAPSYTNLNDGIDFILDERRVELAFEGHRFLDLKRTGKDLIRNAMDCSGLDNACQLLSSDRRFTLPIPAAEINANPNILPQNPGY